MSPETMAEMESQIEEVAALVRKVEEYATQGRYDPGRNMDVAVALAESDKRLNALMLHHSDSLSEEQKETVKDLMRRRLQAKQNTPRPPT